MNSYFITVRYDANQYDFATGASGPEDLLAQISAMNVGAKIAGATARFELTDFSTSRTRGRDYLEFSKWIIA